MLVEPVTRIITPSGPSGPSVGGTPPTSYLPGTDGVTPPISESVPYTHPTNPLPCYVYEPQPVPSLHASSPPLTVSSGAPITSHYSLRLAPPVAAPLSAPLMTAAPSLPTAVPVTTMDGGLGGMAPFNYMDALMTPPMTSPTLPSALPAATPWPFTGQFQFTVEPRSPRSPILQERQSLANYGARSPSPKAGKLQDMAADVEKLSQGHALLRSEFEALKEVARSQSASVEHLKMELDRPDRPVDPPGRTFGDRSGKSPPRKAKVARMEDAKSEAKESPADRLQRADKGWDESAARYWRSIGLGYAVPKEAKEGHFVDKKCPFTGNVSIRGAILKGMCISTKMKRTIIIRRNYLHYIKKFNRFEKRRWRLTQTETERGIAPFFARNFATPSLRAVPDSMWKLSAAAMITSTCGFVPGQVVTTQGGRPRVTGTRGVDVEMGSTFVQGSTMAAVSMVAAGLLLRAKRSKMGCRSETLHGIKFPYALQKDAYADLEFLNDVGYLPDGTPMNRAGNAINHPETIGPDPHTPGSPLPRANFTNSVGYLPDGTPMNAAGNALNHPENMSPDLHTPGSPLPKSFLYANVGYLVDGTDMALAGNLSVQGGAAPAPSMPAMHIDVSDGATVTEQDVLAAQKGWADAIVGISKTYLSGGDYVGHAGQAAGELYGYGHTNVLFKPTKAKDVPFRPDANGAMSYFVGADAVTGGIPEDHGFAINGGKGWSKVVFDNTRLTVTGVEYTFGYKKNADGKVRIFLHHSSLPYGYGSAPAAAAPSVSAAASPAASFTPAPAGGDVLHGIKFPYAIQKDAHVDLAFLNDVGYLPDGTPMNRAGNAINHPETIGPDPHTPGSPLPRALFCNSVGYLPDGTPMNAAGNAMNHPETMQPDLHTPGSPLPKSVYYADVGYLVDGTDMAQAGNLSVQSVAVQAAQAVAAAVANAPPVPPATTPVQSNAPVAAAFVGTSAQTAPLRHSIGFAYSVQKDAYVDLTYGNDVGYLPDGTPMNRAGNAINHPETIGPDPHAPGSPLPRALFVNDVGYLPDGTPMNRAGNAINHPETIGPDPHSPGSALPPSAYAADVGYLVDGTPLDAAGNNAVH
eukprot:symbB.v1.2.025392.t1/scaffold2460.1/size78709/4